MQRCTRRNCQGAPAGALLSAIREAKPWPLVCRPMAVPASAAVAAQLRADAAAFSGGASPPLSSFWIPESQLNALGLALPPPEAAATPRSVRVTETCRWSFFNIAQVAGCASLAARLSAASSSQTSRGGASKDGERNEGSRNREWRHQRWESLALDLDEHRTAVDAALDAAVARRALEGGGGSIAQAMSPPPQRAPQPAPPQPQPQPQPQLWPPFWVRARTLPLSVPIRGAATSVEAPGVQRYFNAADASLLAPPSGAAVVPAFLRPWETPHHFDAATGLLIRFSKEALGAIAAARLPAGAWVAAPLPASLAPRRGARAFVAEVHTRVIVLPLATPAVAADDVALIVASFPPPIHWPPAPDPRCLAPCGHTVWILGEGHEWRGFPAASVLTTGLNGPLPAGCYVEHSVADECGLLRTGSLGGDDVFATADFSCWTLLLFEALVRTSFYHHSDVVATVP